MKTITFGATARAISGIVASSTSRIASRLAAATASLPSRWSVQATVVSLPSLDPPRHLVVRGLYSYTRNPMYNGVVIMLIGEAWLFASSSVIQYAVVVFVAFHLFVVLYEEPVLEAQFRESYLAYRRMVPRWGFTTHAYEVAS